MSFLSELEYVVRGNAIRGEHGNTISNGTLHRIDSVLLVTSENQIESEFGTKLVYEHRVLLGTFLSDTSLHVQDDQTFQRFLFDF